VTEVTDCRNKQEQSSGKNKTNADLKTGYKQLSFVFILRGYCAL